MRKYYVESGPHLQVVLEAENFIAAIIQALDSAAVDAPLLLADMIIVSRRGFVGQRSGHELYGDEIVLPTRLVLGEPCQAEANPTCGD
jgi:hypothetical protein